MTDDQIAAKLDLLLMNQREVREDLTSVKEILTGNGDPSKGLIVRFDRVEQGWMGHKNFTTKMALAAGTGLFSLVGSIALFVVRLKWGI